MSRIVIIMFFFPLVCQAQFKDLDSKKELTKKELKTSCKIPKNSLAVDVKTYSIDSLGKEKLTSFFREIRDKLDTTFFVIEFTGDSATCISRIFWHDNEKVEVCKYSKGLSPYDLIIYRHGFDNKKREVEIQMYGVKKNKMKSMMLTEIEYYESGKVNNRKSYNPDKKNPLRRGIETFLYYSLDSLAWTHVNYSSLEIEKKDSTYQILSWLEKSVVSDSCRIDSALAEPDGSVYDLSIEKTLFNKTAKPVVRSFSVVKKGAELTEDDLDFCKTLRYYYDNENRLIKIEEYNCANKLISKTIYEYSRVNKIDEGLNVKNIKYFQK